MLTEMYSGVKHYVNKKCENENGKAKTAKRHSKRGIIRRQGGGK
jgi:hypothetical protein